MLGVEGLSIESKMLPGHELPNVNLHLCPIGNCPSPSHMTIATERVSVSVAVNESDALEGTACSNNIHPRGERKV